MKTIVKSALGVCAVLGGIAAFQGAVAQSTTTTTTTTAVAPAGGGDFPAGPERALAVKSCTSCHVASQVTSQHKTAEQWATTVNQMIGFGAQVTDDEFDPLVAYLAKSFGAGSDTAAK